jgi:hypothetical protein
MEMVLMICMLSTYKELIFKTDFVRNYSKNLFTWKELADLINVRPLMTQERVHLLDPQKRNFQWYSHGWMKDKNTFPPSLIKLLLEEIVIYFSDMSRATKNLNHFDLQHNVIVQCEGKTNFKVWKEVEDHSIEKQTQLDMSNQKPILDVIMENGDAIWIPRYYPHQAISLTPRLSVSFPFCDNENSSHEKSFEDRNWVTL